VIVAGAGIIGLASAWRMALRGIQVILFEAGKAGGEASWAAAGMLAPSGEFNETSPLLGMAMDSLEQYPQFVAELEESSGLPIDYRQCGAVELALTREEAEALEERAARQARIQIRSKPVGWEGALAARYYPRDALVNPRDLTAALRVACKRAGVVLREHEPVTEIRRGGKEVRTALGKYEADGVLIAAGAWSSDLHSSLPRTMPIRGHLVAYDSQPGRLEPILRHSHTYILQRHTGKLVAGTSTENAGFDRTIDAGIVEDIHSRACMMMPTLKEQRPAECWIGFRPGIERECPAIGRIEGTSIWTAFGHYRNGILLAPDTARRIAASIAGSE
jgi:glycine oxidase